MAKKRKINVEKRNYSIDGFKKTNNRECEISRSYFEEEGRRSEYVSKAIYTPQSSYVYCPSVAVSDIDFFYKSQKALDRVIFYWRKKHIYVTKAMIDKILSETIGTLHSYFIENAKKLQKKCKQRSHQKKLSSSSQTPKENEMKNNNKCISKRTDSLSMVPEAVYVCPSRRKPKYGYARDYFGRIQERDHYVENRSVNSYHCNSNYDREDDNDSMYDGFE